jgi:polyhydroxybutyrate depolymerase
MRLAHIIFKAWIGPGLMILPLNAQTPPEPPTQLPTPLVQALTLNYAPGKVTAAKMQYGGVTRELHYYVPKNFDPQAKHPLIFVLHGYNQPVATIISGYATMQPKADKDGTILVYPVSTGSYEKKNLGWNSRYPSAKEPSSIGNGADDIGYLTFVMDTFQSCMNVDPDRIYVTGTSNGGAMTYACGCYLADKLAAVAPVIMQIDTKLAKEFATAKPLPVMIITGTADPLVAEAGSDRGMMPFLSADKNIDYWKERNGISQAPVKTDLLDVTQEVFKGKPSPSHIEKYYWANSTGNEIIWLKVVGGGHWLPANTNGKPIDASNINGFDGSYMGVYNNDYDASGAIYDFLLSHTRK